VRTLLVSRNFHASHAAKNSAKPTTNRVVFERLMRAFYATTAATRNGGRSARRM